MKSVQLKQEENQSKAAANHPSSKGISELPPASRSDIQRMPAVELPGAAPQTDNSFLITTGVLSVSPDGGTTDEPHPQAGVEYDFTVNIVNAGQLPSGPFFVRFELSGDQNPPINLDYQNDTGLAPGESVMAVVHYGSFPNVFGVYHLNASIYSPSAPDTPIFRFPAGNDYTIHTQ